jgi:glycerol kinase|tara:strand:+ start:6582 stop:6992 length:411 start_codon:yes stop_codon:yes gene_type:complete
MAVLTHVNNDVKRIFDKYEAITVGSSLTLADSGKVFKVSGTGGTVTLPAVSEGFIVRFVTTGGLTSANTVIAGGTSDVMEGSIIVAGAVVDVDAADQLNFVHTADNLGDYVDIWSDGSKYFVFGNALNSGGITATG